MKTFPKWGYESPECEEFCVYCDENFVSTVTSDKDPVGGSEEGDTDDWGWN